MFPYMRIRTTFAAALLMGSCFMGGCASATSDVDREETASAVEAELASMPARERELIAAARASVDDLTKVVATLKAELSALEKQNEARLAELQTITASIEARKREVEAEYERKKWNSLLFCWVGLCDLGRATLLSAIADDSRIRQLEGDLARVKQDQARIAARIEDYKERKASAETSLAALTDAEASLRALYTGKRVVADGAVSGGAASMGLKKAQYRYSLEEQLCDNLDAQITLLTTLLQEAQAISSLATEAVARAKQASARATALRKASAAEWAKLLRMAVSPDPNAAAQRWMDEWVANKTKQLVREAGFPVWDPADFVGSLIASTFGANANSPAAQALSKELIARLRF